MPPSHPLDMTNRAKAAEVSKNQSGFWDSGPQGTLTPALLFLQLPVGCRSISALLLVGGLPASEEACWWHPQQVSGWDLTATWDRPITKKRGGNEFKRYYKGGIDRFSQFAGSWGWWQREGALRDCWLAIWRLSYWVVSLWAVCAPRSQGYTELLTPGQPE